MKNSWDVSKVHLINHRKRHFLDDNSFVTCAVFYDPKIIVNRKSAFRRSLGLFRPAFFPVHL